MKKVGTGKKGKQKEKEQGIRAEKLEQELHEAKTHLNSLQLSAQAAEQTSVTAQGQVMAVVLTMVALCLAFVHRGWKSAVAGVHMCLELSSCWLWLNRLWPCSAFGLAHPVGAVLAVSVGLWQCLPGF